MLFVPITVRYTLADARLGPDAVLDGLVQALRDSGAIVDAAAAGEIVFRCPVKETARYGLSEPDLGLITGGTIEIERTAQDYRLLLRARPRPWFLALTLLPLLLLAWGFGLTAPWRYALAFGGIPVFALLWIVVWANLTGFLEWADKRIHAIEGVGADGHPADRVPDRGAGAGRVTDGARQLPGPGRDQ